MEYQKIIISLLENKPNQPSKFRAKSCFEVNDESRGIYNINSRVKFKTSMLRSIIYDYSDAYILVSANTYSPKHITTANNRKNVIIKNFAPFTNCISEINHSQIDNAKDFDIVMAMYYLIEYSGSYSETSGSLWHYYRYEPFLDNGAIADFPANKNSSVSFKFKTKMVGRTENDGTKIVKTSVPLKYLSNFWRTLEIPLINREINLILTWSDRCFVIDNLLDNQKPTFTIIDTKLYVPIVTSSTQDNAKLLEQLKSCFKRTTNWNKYDSKSTVDQQNQYLDFLINPSFQGVN